MPVKAKKPSKTKISKVKVVANRKPSGMFSALRSRWTTTAVVLAFVVAGVGTLTWAMAATTTYSLWTNANVPKTLTDSDTQGVELGTKFRSKYAGQVLGVRFYKGPQNTGAHTGNLWTNDGRKLASVVFTDETASGWQSATFPKPIDITANTTYVISYYASKGHYSANNKYFTVAYKKGPLTAPKNAGVYRYGSSSAFPNQTYQQSNYWVDVVMSTSRFFPSDKPLAPTNLQATSADGSVNLTWTPSTSIGVAKYEVLRGGTKIATLDAAASGYKDSAVTSGNTYSYQVRAVDVNNVASDLSNAVSVMVVAPAPTPPTPEPTPTPTPTPQPNNPPPVSFPGPTNTGYQNAPGYPGKLTRYSETPNGTECSGPITSGKTYRFCDFVSKGGGWAAVSVGSVGNYVENVTFYGCRFLGNAVENTVIGWQNGNNMVIDYGTIAPLDPATGGQVPPRPGGKQIAYGKGFQYGINQSQDDRADNYLHGDGFTLDHSDMYGFGNGIQLGRVTAQKPVIIKNTWFHDASADGGGIYHTDAILSSDGSGIQYLTVDHNTIVSEGNTNGLALQYEDHAYENITVTGNYFSGFGYTVNIGGSGSAKNRNVVFTGNTFGTDIKPMWGPLYSWSDGNGNLWRNNKWHVAPGGYSTATGDDGKYWLPSGSLSTTDHNK